MYNSKLDKMLPRQRGKRYYDSLSRGEKEQAMRDLGTFTRAFDEAYRTSLYQAMQGAGFRW